MKLMGEIVEIHIKNLFIKNYLYDKLGYVDFESKLKNTITINEDIICDLKTLKLHSEEYCFVNKEKYIFVRFRNSYLYCDKKKNSVNFFVKENERECVEIEFGQRLFYIVAMLLSQNKIIALHGGAFQLKEYKNKGILVVGDSGSGKTSIVLNAVKYGGYYSCEENMYIYMGEYPYRVLLNKQEISLCRVDLNKTDTDLIPFVTENPYVNKGKVRIDVKQFLKDNYKCEIIPSIIVILNQKKEETARFRKLNRVEALKKLIHLHNIYEEYEMQFFVILLLDLIQKTEQYELYPSIDINITHETIKKIIEANK